MSRGTRHALPSSRGTRHALPAAALVALSLALLHGATRRTFWNGDDAFELPIGRLLGEGALSCWWQASSHAGHTGLRVLPRLLWGLDWAVWGPNAAGYYATNIALHVACVLIVYALAARWTGSRGAAFVAGVVFAFLGPTAQVVMFLSAREDSLATLAFAGAVLLWPRADEHRGARLGAAALYLVVCLSKLSGVLLPGVLLAVDLARMAPREALSPRRLLRVYGPLAVVVAGTGAAWLALIGLDGAGRYASLRPHAGADAGWIAAENLYQGLLAPLTERPRGPWGPSAHALTWAPAILLPLGATLGLLRGRRAALPAAAWILLALLPPAALLGWSPEQSWADGRYFHLASAGLALLIALGIAPGPGAAPSRLALGAGGLLAATLAGAFQLLVVPLFPLHGQVTRDLSAAVEEASGALGPGGRLVLSWPRADPGMRRVLDGGFLRAIAPSVPERYFVLVEGTTTLLSVLRAESGRLDRVDVALDDFSIDELRPGRDALVAQVVRTNPFEPGGARFESVPLPIARGRGRRTGAEMTWTLGTSDGSWSLGPGADSGRRSGEAITAAPAGRREGGGLSWTAPGGLDRPGNPAPPPALHLPELLGPTMPMDPEAICSLDVDLEVDVPPGPPGRRRLEPWNFGVLHWSIGPGGPYFGGALAFEVASGRQVVHLDLGNSPSWRRSPTVRRLGLTPSARAGRVRVRSVTARWCGG